MIPKEPDITPTFLYNPSKDDFIYPYNGQDQFMPSREITTFPKFLADHLAKHLAQKLALEDGSKIHYEDRLARWLDKIYVKL